MKLSKMQMGGAGSAMMHKLARDQNVSSPKELIEMCVELGVNLWPCEMSMELMGIERDQLIDGVGEPVGAATSTWRPPAIAGQAWRCASVGPPGNARANQPATAGWKPAVGSTGLGREGGMPALSGASPGRG